MKSFGSKTKIQNFQKFPKFLKMLKDKWRTILKGVEQRALIDATSRGCVVAMYGDNVLRMYCENEETELTKTSSPIVAIANFEKGTILATQDSHVWYVDQDKVMKMLPYRIPDVVDIVSVSPGIVAIASRLRATALVWIFEEKIKYLHGLERETPTCLLCFESRVLQGDVDGTITSYDPRTENYCIVREENSAVRGLTCWNSKLYVRLSETYKDQPFENYSTVVRCTQTGFLYAVRNKKNKSQELVCFDGERVTTEERGDDVPRLLRSIVRVTRTREETEREIEACKRRLYVLRQTIETTIDLREGDWNRNTRILDLKLWGDVVGGDRRRRVGVRWKRGGEIMMCLRNETSSISETLRGGEDQVTIPLDWNRSNCLVLRGNLYWRSIESNFVHIGTFELDLLDFSRKTELSSTTMKYFSCLPLETTLENNRLLQVEGAWRTFENEYVTIRVERNQLRIKTETQETLAWIRDALRRRGFGSFSKSIDLKKRKRDWKENIERVELLRERQNSKSCVSSKVMNVAMDEAIRSVVDVWYE